MSGTATAFSVGLHCWNWTRVPAFGMLNTPAHLFGFVPLDEEVNVLQIVCTFKISSQAASD